MTARVATSPDEIDAAMRAVRRSVRPATAAEMLDCDRSQVYKLIKGRELETHGLGKRGVRIYLDSIEAYRERKAGRGPSPAPRKAQKLGAEFYENCARLRALGLM